MNFLSVLRNINIKSLQIFAEIIDDKL